MHTIKLNVGDKAYRHLMFLLKNLRSSEIEVIEDKQSDESLHSIDLSAYKIKSFKNIKDPLKWQQEIRSEWE